MGSTIVNNPLLFIGDYRPRRSDYQPINNQQVETEYFTRLRICVIILYSIIVISSFTAIYCGYIIVPSIIIVMSSIGYCAYESLKDLYWSRFIGNLEIIFCCCDAPQLGLVPQQRFRDPSSIHQSFPVQSPDRLNVQEPLPQLPVIVQRGMWRYQDFYNPVSPNPISLSVYDSPLLAPSGSDELPLSSPPKVDELPLSSPPKVDELPLSSPPKVDKLSLSSPSSTNESPFPAPVIVKRRVWTCRDFYLPDFPIPSSMHDSIFQEMRNVIELQLSLPPRVCESLLSAPATVDESPLSSPSGSDELPLLSTSSSGESPLPTPSILDESPLPAPSSVDESPLPAPSSVDESPLPAPSSVDESPLAAPSSVDEPPLPAPSSVDEPPLPAPSSVDESPPSSEYGKAWTSMIKISNTFPFPIPLSEEDSLLSRPLRVNKSPLLEPPNVNTSTLSAPSSKDDSTLSAP